MVRSRPRSLKCVYIELDGWFGTTVALIVCRHPPRVRAPLDYGFSWFNAGDTWMESQSDEHSAMTSQVATQDRSNAIATDVNQTLSDVEIARQLLEIRQGWNLRERIARREHAATHFGDLINTLRDSVAA